jgi:hypothetical protein
MANKFTKTVTFNGSEPCYHLATREQYKRQTNLPANWKIARLAMIASITAAAGDNVTPVNDQCNPSIGFHQDWLFGLSDGTGFPGDAAGGKFVGFHLSPSYTLYVRNSSGWKLSYDQAAGAIGSTGIWLNNASSGVSGVPASGITPGMTDPSAVASYCFGLMLQLDVSTAGSLVVSYAVTNGLSRADSAQMSAILSLVATVTHTAITGGWWTGSVPVNCQYWFMRWPASLNHMRIHNMDYMQLA